MSKQKVRIIVSIALPLFVLVINLIKYLPKEIIDTDYSITSVSYRIGENQFISSEDENIIADISELLMNYECRRSIKKRHYFADGETIVLHISFVLQKHNVVKSIVLNKDFQYLYENNKSHIILNNELHQSMLDILSEYKIENE